MIRGHEQTRHTRPNVSETIGRVMVLCSLERNTSAREGDCATARSLKANERVAWKQKEVSRDCYHHHGEQNYQSDFHAAREPGLTRIRPATLMRAIITSEVREQKSEVSVVTERAAAGRVFFYFTLVG
jgi:hypothetical protein